MLSIDGSMYRRQIAMDKQYVVIGNGKFNEPDAVLGYGRDPTFIAKCIKDSAAKGIKVSLCEQVDVNLFMLEYGR